MRFTALEDALRRLETRQEEESEARVTSEKQLRDEVEKRIMGVEKRMESEIGKQLTDAAGDIAELREQLLQLSGEAARDKGEVQALRCTPEKPSQRANLTSVCVDGYVGGPSEGETGYRGYV